MTVVKDMSARSWVSVKESRKNVTQQRCWYHKQKRRQLYFFQSHYILSIMTKMNLMTT